MMTGLVFLADSFDITNRHIHASASQHIQPDGNLAFAIDIDQFTNQPGQRSFHNTDLLTIGIFKFSFEITVAAVAS